MPIAAKYNLRKLVLLSGTCPFDEWFDKLETEDKYMVETRLLRVRLGSFGEINNVGNGVWELKFRKGRALRLYYGHVGQQIILLLMGGDKRTQKRDIGKAKSSFAAYRTGELKDAKC